MSTLQILPVMKTGFSLCRFSLQGKTCNENRFFPVFITGMGLQCTYNRSKFSDQKVDKFWHLGSFEIGLAN